jgi:N6-L-threonylcarbamoyladenine synthase
MPHFDFSFSGIKTAFLYFLDKNIKNNPNFIAENQVDLCASIQHRLVSMLLDKVKKAMKELGASQVALAGGVACNKGLRQAMAQIAQQEGWQLFVPKEQYCTDNAAMVAMTAYYQYLEKDFLNLSTPVSPALSL